QDIDFDQNEKLCSVPARFGVATTLYSSIVLHIITVAALTCVGLTLHLGPLFFVGLLVVTAMLIYEHAIISPSDLSRVNAAFFTVNGVVSILAFLAILLDRIFFPS
ncbi:MAG TPA: UbiA family prenyltransferase, partial [Chroococcales cyanobacterium]